MASSGAGDGRQIRRVVRCRKWARAGRWLEGEGSEKNEGPEKRSPRGKGGSVKIGGGKKRRLMENIGGRILHSSRKREQGNVREPVKKRAG